MTERRQDDKPKYVQAMGNFGNDGEGDALT
jgi:hypothetical protein